MLAQGEVKVLIDGAEVARLQRGAHFGEQALLTNELRNADVIATDEVAVLELSQEDFQPIVAQVRQAIEAEQAKRQMNSTSMTPSMK